MTDEQIAAIARGLSEAQKRLMRNHPFWAASSYVSIKACRERGLFDGATITPLGQRVKVYLLLLQEQG